VLYPKLRKKQQQQQYLHQHQRRTVLLQLFCVLHLGCDLYAAAAAAAVPLDAPPPSKRQKVQPALQQDQQLQVA
jgi:hypothetical protein